MIIAVPRWNDPDAYYSQTNNVVEAILAKAGADHTLETCGPTSAVMVLAAMGFTLACSTPGGWQPQPEDILAAWFNDARNYPLMRSARPELDPATVLGNEVPQYYPLALSRVFGVRAIFAWGLTGTTIRDALSHGRGIIVTLQQPGHYIAVVGYDTDSSEVIYHDPWPGNRWPARYSGTPGRERRLRPDELSNIKPYRIEVMPDYPE